MMEPPAFPPPPPPAPPPPASEPTAAPWIAPTHAPRSAAPTTNRSRKATTEKRQRSPLWLFLQIAVGGGAGTLLAFVILKYIGAGPFREREIAKAENPPPKVERANEKPAAPPKNNNKPPIAPPQRNPKAPNNNPPRNNQVRNNPPRNNPRNQANPAANPRRPGEVSSDNIELPPLPANRQPAPFPDNGDLPQAVTLDPEAPARIQFPAIFEVLRKANLSQSSRVWWCNQFSFELDDKGTFWSTDQKGELGYYYPLETSTKEYVELESEGSNRRIRLYPDHADLAQEPFTNYQPFLKGGKWLVSAQSSEVPWLPAAVDELEALCTKTRYNLNEAMLGRFRDIEAVFHANQLKKAPFGFNPSEEREKFRMAELVPWSEPLLPMTENYIAECRKLHRALDIAYGRVATRLATGAKEKAAREFLEFHQWRFNAAWRLAVLKWHDPANGQEVECSLLSNGAVDDEFSKDAWKLTGETLNVDFRGKKLRIKIGQQGKDFTILNLEPSTKGVFETTGIRDSHRWRRQ